MEHRGLAGSFCLTWGRGHGHGEVGPARTVHLPPLGQTEGLGAESESCLTPLSVRKTGLDPDSGAARGSGPGVPTFCTRKEEGLPLMRADS